MKVNLMRKLWKERVQIPVLKKQSDKILKKIYVKLKRRNIC